MPEDHVIFWVLKEKELPSLVKLAHASQKLKWADVTNARGRVCALLKLLIWWCYMDLLSAKACICRVSQIQDDTCFLCSSERETTLHTLWSVITPRGHGSCQRGGCMSRVGNY